MRWLLSPGAHLSRIGFPVKNTSTRHDTTDAGRLGSEGLRHKSAGLVCFSYCRTKHGRVTHVITVDDPLETWLPTKLLRMAYRPFETDADWGSPFTRDTLRAIQRAGEGPGHLRLQQVGHSARLRRARYARHWAKAWHEKDLAFVYELPLAA
jgi:hypothetical protein